jgi:hypothetical protein
MAQQAVRQQQFLTNEAGAFQRGAAANVAREAMAIRGVGFSGAAVQAEAAADAQVGAAIAEAQAQFSGQLFSRLTEMGMADQMGRRMAQFQNQLAMQRAEFESNLRVDEAVRIDDATRPSGWGQFLTGAFQLAGSLLFPAIGAGIGKRIAGGGGLQ